MGLESVEGGGLTEIRSEGGEGFSNGVGKRGK